MKAEEIRKGPERLERKTAWLVSPIMILILILGFYLRFESISETTVVIPLGADSKDYFMYAYNLRHKHIYSSGVGTPVDLTSPVAPDAIRSPGYPLYLTPFVSGLPDREMIRKILISQALMSGLTILLSFYFFRTFLPTWGATIGSLLVALSPHLVVANSYVLTETLFCFLLVLFAWVTSLFWKRPSLWLGLLVGITMGIASLVRPSLEYFLLIMAVFSISYYGWRKGFRPMLFLLLGFALSLAPWVYRNMATLHVPTDRTLMINFLHHGMYPHFTFDEVRESYGFPYRYDPRSAEISKDVSSVLREISRRFREQTWKHLKWFVLAKPAMFWSWSMVQGYGDIFVHAVSKSPYFDNRIFRYSRKLMHRIHWPIVLLCAVGSLMAWFPLSRLSLAQESVTVARFISLLLIYYTALHMVGAPFPRYSVPLRPLLYGMAAFVPYLLIISFRASRSAPSPPPSHYEKP